MFRNPDEPEPTAQEQRQAQILQSQLSPHELAYQESLIQEREHEIREIETGIHELAEIFHDLGTLVNQQGGMIGEYQLWSCLSCHLHYLRSVVSPSQCFLFIFRKLHAYFPKYL